MAEQRMLASAGTKAMPDTVWKCPEHLPPGPSPRAMAHDEEQKRNYFAFGGAGDMRGRRWSTRSAANQIEPFHISAEIAASMPAATASRRWSSPCSPTTISPTGIVPG